MTLPERRYWVYVGVGQEILGAGFLALGGFLDMGEHVPHHVAAGVSFLGLSLATGGHSLVAWARNVPCKGHGQDGGDGGGPQDDGGRSDEGGPSFPSEGGAR